MTSQVVYFADPEENACLLEYAESIGLIPVAPLLGREIDRINPASGPFIYLSAVPIDELHPYGPEKNKITDAIDPILPLIRSYVDGHSLVAGNLMWVDDVPEVARFSKKYFGKLKRWIQRHFSHIGNGIYKSDGAGIMEASGMKLTSIPPSAKVEYIKVPAK